MNCPYGGFPSIRHNELCDITALLLTEVCHAVEREPCLQPLSGEQLKYKTANDANEARLDVVAENIGPRTGRRLFLCQGVQSLFKILCKHTTCSMPLPSRAGQTKVIRTESEKLSMVAFHLLYFQPLVDLVPLLRSYTKELLT